MSDYYTLLTNAGIAYETACKASGTPIKLTQMSVGDGNGAVYNPDATAAALRREVWRGNINALMQDAKNLSWLLAEVTIPNEVGGWYVREAGIWTDTGILYAVIKYPESFKPVMAGQGAGKEFYIRAIFQTSNAANVVLSIDDSIVKATRAWVAEYVASELAKLDAKKSVRVSATGPIVLSGAQTVDGVAVIAGDSVLAPFQAAAASNGIYLVENGAWVRRPDADASIEVTPNLLVSVEEGTKYADTLWQLTTNAPIVLGATALAFEMVSGPTGISPGTYRQVTVDRRGLVIGGANPTSLAGFGITDVYTKTEADSRYPTTEDTTAIGMAAGDPDQMYMRRRSDGSYFFVQKKIPYPVVQQGTGVGQMPNAVKIGYSDVGVKITVDATDFGKIWTGSNFDPNSKASWGSTLSAYGITDAYTKAESDARDAQRPIADAISLVGFANDNTALPYFRRLSDSQVYYLQPRLGYSPIEQGGGAYQLANKLRIGYNGALSLRVQVDATDMGDIIIDGNISAKIAGLGLSAVGSYAFARCISNADSINQGGLVAGTNLIYSSTNASDGATSNSGLINVGTWRLHGALSVTERTLFQRVS